MYEQIGQVGLFLELPALERSILEVANDAYDRDDVNDSFAFINGHAVPVFYSVDVILQALRASDPRIREQGAVALGYLIRHRGHRCYSRTDDDALEAARKTLEDVSERLKDNALLEVFLSCLERRAHRP